MILFPSFQTLPSDCQSVIGRFNFLSGHFGCIFFFSFRNKIFVILWFWILNSIVSDDSSYMYHLCGGWLISGWVIRKKENLGKWVILKIIWFLNRATMKKYKWERPMNSRSKLFNAARNVYTKISFMIFLFLNFFF